MIVVDTQHPILRKALTYCALTVLCHHHDFVLLRIKSIRISTIGASALTPFTFDFENFISLRTRNIPSIDDYDMLYTQGDAPWNPFQAR